MGSHKIRRRLERLEAQQVPPLGKGLSALLDWNLDPVPADSVRCEGNLRGLARLLDSQPQSWEKGDAEQPQDSPSSRRAGRVARG
jgi:hypothetical protein